jgi:hypothetical protein
MTYQRDQGNPMVFGKYPARHTSFVNLYWRALKPIERILKIMRKKHKDSSSELLKKMRNLLNLYLTILSLALNG